MKPILQTSRLLLREMTEDDLPALRSILQDPQVMYAYEHAFSEEEVRAWLAKQRRRYAEDGFGLWAMVLRQTGAMIGQCGLTWQDRGDGTRCVEVGYLLQRAFWHQGYAREAAAASRRMALSSALGAPSGSRSAHTETLPGIRAKYTGMSTCSTNLFT